MSNQKQIVTVINGYLSGAKKRKNFVEISNLAEIEAKNWFSANGSQLNEAKTKKLVLDNSAKDHCSLRYLGLEFESTLSWRVHIDGLCKRLSTSLFLIRRIKQIADLETAKLTYFSTFYGVALYGIVLWGQCSDASRVLLLQKRALRILFGIKNTDSPPRREGLLTITSAYILASVNYVHQHMDRFKLNSHNHGHDTRGPRASRPFRKGSSVGK